MTTVVAECWSFDVGREAVFLVLTDMVMLALGWNETRKGIGVRYE